MKSNIILLTDSYKFSHFNQYPSNTTKIFSYFESRGGEYQEVYFFGLQYYLKKYLIAPVTNENIIEAEAISAEHGLPFNKKGWEYIVNKLDGKLPVRIRAVKEGSIIPVKNVLFTIENTDPSCFWLTTYLETLLVKIWSPVTAATKIHGIKQLIKKYHQATSDDDVDATVAFALHNFGDRASTSVESAAINGMAHLTQFAGTDNVACLRAARFYYDAPLAAGFSIPASEHATVTTWGPSGERAFLECYLEAYKQSSIIACVGDSFNIYNFVDLATSEPFKTKIESDQYPILVIRPDSGDHVTVLTRILDIFETNDVAFTTNSKGYKLFSKYRLIWGDGVNSVSIESMLKLLKKRGYNAANINFGSGGEIMQNFTRDTLEMAMKCSSITLKNKTCIDVFKCPVDAVEKWSKKGELELVIDADSKKIKTVKRVDVKAGDILLLEDVFVDGKLVRDQSFAEIKALKSKF